LEYQEKMKKEFGFGYKNGVGEAIWAMVICCPEISTAVVKMCTEQCMPTQGTSQRHQTLLKYLWCTRRDGIYFWSQSPVLDLTDHPLPTVDTVSHGDTPPQAKRPKHGPLVPRTFMDSDWATCLKARPLLSGIGVKMAGGPVAYNTRLQPTVKLSSTEGCI
jgi:hypothetical protein